MGIDYTKPMADIDAQIKHEFIVEFIWFFGGGITIADIILLVVL